MATINTNEPGFIEYHILTTNSMELMDKTKELEVADQKLESQIMELKYLNEMQKDLIDKLFIRQNELDHDIECLLKCVLVTLLIVLALGLFGIWVHVGG